jgi:ParB-like chromosome segregation protein Spo0J
MSSIRTRHFRGKDYPISPAHPAAESFPWYTDDELQTLADDIRDNGQKYPIKKLPDGRVIDGRNRELAARIAGTEPRFETVRLAESEVTGYVISLNLIRRHLDGEQRREVVRLLKLDGKSNRTIAGLLKVSEGTVRNDLRASGAQSYAPDRITGQDGKQYPAAKPTPAPELPRTRADVLADAVKSLYQAVEGYAESDEGEWLSTAKDGAKRPFVHEAIDQMRDAATHANAAPAPYLSSEDRRRVVDLAQANSVAPIQKPTRFVRCGWLRELWEALSSRAKAA